MSAFVNDAVWQALAEDAEELAAFEEQADAPMISVAEIMKRLKEDGRIEGLFSRVGLEGSTCNPQAGTQEELRPRSRCNTLYSIGSTFERFICFEASKISIPMILSSPSISNTISSVTLLFTI
jgi:hypothetical protein